MQTTTGTAITWKNDGTAVALSGSVIKIGVFIGVLATDIHPGETGAVIVAGVHRLPKTTGEYWQAGARLRYNEATGAFVLGAGGGIGCVAAQAADVDEDSALILLNAGAGESGGGGGGPVDWSEIENKPTNLATTEDVDAKVFVAEYNVTTAQEIIAYASATKEPFAAMVVKRGNDYYTVTTIAKQADNKVVIRTFSTLSGDFYMFTYTITDGTWAAASYGFQKKLESGTNIKTINGQSLLGDGNIEIQGGGTVDQTYDATSTNAQSGTAVAQAVAGKQAAITGGTTGQILVKKSNADGDFKWDEHPSWYAPSVEVTDWYVYWEQADDTGSSYGAMLKVAQDGSGASLNGDGLHGVDLASKSFVTNSVAGKQDALISGTNIKTIENVSLLGNGVVNFKTLNNESLIGQGNIVLGGTASVTSDVSTNHCAVVDSRGNTDIGFTANTGNTFSISCFGVIDEGRGTTGYIFNVVLPDKTYVDNAVKKRVIVGEEQMIGEWVENNVTYDLYEKIVDIGALPNNGTKTVAHGITNVVKFVKTEGQAVGNNNLSIPFINGDGTLFIYMGVGGNNINIQTNSDRSGLNGYAYLRYIRNRS